MDKHIIFVPVTLHIKAYAVSEAVAQENAVSFASRLVSELVSDSPEEITHQASCRLLSADIRPTKKPELKTADEINAKFDYLEYKLRKDYKESFSRQRERNEEAWFEGCFHELRRQRLTELEEVQKRASNASTNQQ